MAQYSRPDGGDTWIPVGAPTCWQAIDEVFPPSDVDYCTQVAIGPVTTTFTMSDVLDPTINTSHVLRVRAALLNDLPGTATLYCGAVPICSEPLLPNIGWTTFTHNLSEPEAALITDYTDLTVVVDALLLIGGINPGIIGVSWIEFEVIDVPTFEMASGTISATSTVGLAPYEIAVSWMELEVPGIYTDLWGAVSASGTIDAQSTVDATAHIPAISGWGLRPWGLSCWGTCRTSNSIRVNFGINCDTTGNSRSGELTFVITATDPGDSVQLDTVVVVIDGNNGDPSVPAWLHNFTVYSSSAFNAPWTGTVVPFGNGHEFTITFPDTLPPNIEICITIYAETFLEEENTVECCWTTEDEFSISIEIISLTKLLVNFSDQMTASGSGVATASNWEIIPVGTGFIDNTNNIVQVKTVAPDSGRNPAYVILNTTEMVWNQRYQVRCKNLIDIYSRTVGAEALFLMRKTRVDEVLNNLPSVWKVDGTSNFFWVLATTSRTLEKIGGFKKDQDI